MPLKHSLASRVAIKALREKYPSPKPAWTEGRTLADYSVGGALCCELSVELGCQPSDPPLFPMAERVVEALYLCNNNLPKLKAQEFAHDIVEKNEEELFEDAWAALEEALNYG